MHSNAERDLAVLEMVAAKGVRLRRDVETTKVFGAEVGPDVGLMIERGLVREVDVKALELTDAGLEALARLTSSRARARRAGMRVR